MYRVACIENQEKSIQVLQGKRRQNTIEDNIKNVFRENGMSASD